jgi:hypothetical protein
MMNRHTTLIRLRHLLPFPRAKEFILRDVFPAQSDCTGQRRADFPCAFSAFQFVRIREICAVSLRLRVFALKK